MIHSPLKSVTIVMLAVQIASLCDPLTVATTHASPAASGNATTALRSVTAAFLYDPDAASFQVVPAPTLAEQFAASFLAFDGASSPGDETARVPRAVSAILTPIVTPYGPVWVDAAAMEPLTAESSAQSEATRAPGIAATSETTAGPDLNPFMIGAAPSAASAYGPQTAPANSDLGAGKPEAIPDNEPDRGEDAPAPATESKAPSSATTAAALNAHPEAAGATAIHRSSRSSFWMWTGSAVVVGLFVAGMSHDLSNDKSPPPEPQSLPDFPDAP